MIEFMHDASPVTSTCPRAPAFSLLLVGMLTIAGCSGSSDSDGDPDPVSGTTPTDATGDAPGQTTDMSSNGDGSAATAGSGTATALTGTWELCTGGDLKSTYVFEGDRFEQFHANYADPNCAGEPLQPEGGASPFEPFVAGIFTLGAELIADSGVQARELDFSVRSVFGNPATVPLDTSTIVSFISPTELVMPMDRGNTPDRRSLTLNFDSVYTRVD